MAKVPRTALNETPTQSRHGAFGHSPEDADAKAHGDQCRKDQKQWAGGLNSAEDSIEQNGVNDKKDGVWDDEKNLKPSNPKSQRRKRAQKHCRAKLNEDLTGDHQPRGTGAGVAIHGVEQDHGDDGKRETQEPEQRTGVTETEIEVSEGGQQERRQNKGRKVI